MQAQLVIDNKAQWSSKGATFERRHPVTGEVVTRAAAASVEDAIAVVESAERAFKSWRHSGPSERRRILLKAADALEAKSEEIAKTMAGEMGASAMWAGFNVFAAANIFREAAGLATQIQGETIPTDKPGALSMTVRQPAGVVLSIVPWNGPVLLAARAIAYPIVCGNSVVFRASEQSPRTHFLVAQALVEAGLPAGVLNLITHAPQDASEITEAMIAHKAVRRVNFTGSTRVGRVIAQKAAAHLKRCLLELGGKAPLVLLDDADVDAAVRAAVFGSFMFQGQICMSTERIVVDDSIADAFVAKFAAKVKELPAGDPREDGGIIIGPMVSKENGPRLNALIDDAVAKGAILVCGGHAEGAVMGATILDHVKPGMKIYYEETFGPITTIVRVMSVDEAVSVANDTEYGLSAAVFGRDSTRALSVALQIDSGTLHVNGSTVQNEAQAPYGGMKDSGYGRFDGRAVIEEFTDLKWVTVEPAHQTYPF